MIKEVLRRENQGLKVYPVDGSDVFSITGTYFYFVLSMMSGLILKKMPEAGILFCYNSSCAQLQFQDSESSGGASFLRISSWRQVLCMTPSPNQSPKENKLKLWPKYVYVL